jgi:hypothetical protein
LLIKKIILADQKNAFADQKNNFADHFTNSQKFYVPIVGAFPMVF